MDGIPDTRLVNAALYFATRNKQLNFERHCNANYSQRGTSVEYEPTKPGLPVILRLPKDDTLEAACDGI